MYHICQTFLVFLHLLTLNDYLCRYRLVASKVIDWQGQGYSSEAIKGGWISSLVSLVFGLGLVGNIFWLGCEVEGSSSWLLARANINIGAREGYWDLVVWRTAK